MNSTEILSIYAAILSTIVFMWNIRRAIPRFKVEIILGSDNIDGEFVNGVYISVKNPSPHAVHLEQFEILSPYKKASIFEKILHTIKYRSLPSTVGWIHSGLSYYKVNDGFPLTLEPGKAHGFLIPESVLKELLEESDKKEIKASVMDQLWRRKYSKKFKYRFLHNE